MELSERILYEDNHLIAVNKLPSEIVQGDSTGDEPLASRVARFIKGRDGKPGNVFLGIPHRIDRPSSGIVLFAKTEKALSRISGMFKERRVKKCYWIVLDAPPPADRGELVHFLRKDGTKNKSFASQKQRSGAKEAKLAYELIAATSRYYLVEVELLTGRHHQIRAQFAAVGCHVKGDLKYGAPRSNPGGGIHLHARRLEFIHPVRKTSVQIIAPPPKEVLWDVFASMASDSGDSR